MKITYTDYVELPGALDVVVPFLQDDTTWLALPTGGERLGKMWRWGSELYTVRFAPSNDPTQAPQTCTWEAVPLLSDGMCMTLTVTCHDAIVATHVVVGVVLDKKGILWPWEKLRSHMHIGSIVRTCHARLRDMLIAKNRYQHQRADTSVDTSASDGVLAFGAAHAHEQQGAHAHAGVDVVHPTSDTMHAMSTMPSLLSMPSAPATALAMGTDGDGNAPAPAPAPVGDTHISYEHMPVAQTSHTLADRLRAHYPKTVAAFEQMQAYDHLERIWYLERHWDQMMRGTYTPDIYATSNTIPSDTTTDYDLIYAGGGLGLLHAAVMAYCYGWRVLVFDRGEVGHAHREWNISRAELEKLVDIGVATWSELQHVIMREYRTGLVSFYTGAYSSIAHSDLWLPNVLSLAIDANALLRLMRRKLEAVGSTVLDYRAFQRVRVNTHTPLRVEVDVQPVQSMADDGHGACETYTARLLLDAMGSTSPLALLRHKGCAFAGVCPTVGTAVSGFVQGDGPRELDSSIGDILISVADTQGERQFIWEGFPGRDDEVAVYVFYYVTLNNHQATCTSHHGMPHAISQDHQASTNNHTPAVHAPVYTAAGSYHQTTYSLLELFEHYFALLPSYKRPGPNFRHLKPLYGYIPGRHSLRPHAVPLLRGVLPIGDAAAQQSPLTYCGFGSHVRNLHRTTSLLHYALGYDVLEPHHLRHVHAFQTNVSLNWVFSRFMAPWGHPHNVNELQNVFLSTLNELGIPLAARFFQDQTRWSDYNKIIGTVLQRYPVIMTKAWRVLKQEGVNQWVLDYTRFTLEALFASTVRRTGKRFEQFISTLGTCISPSLGLRIRSRYAEWRAMKWVE